MLTKNEYSLFSILLMEKRLSIEKRVKLFYELHNNKWFHRMNLSLEIIKMSDKSQKVMLARYGYCFFYL